MDSSVEITVAEGIENCRADKVLADCFDDLSRTRIQEAFDAGNVRMDGVIIEKRQLVSTGDLLSIILPPKKEVKVCPVDIPLDVIFEDDDIVVINKASGMVTHPGAGTGEDTAVHALLHHCNGKLSAESGRLRPGVVHRLDKETSGVMVFAKSDIAYVRLVEQFSNREVNKNYLAIAQGVPGVQAGSIVSPITRHPRNRAKMQVSSRGKEAHTDWSMLEKWDTKASLISCKIHTGRTHQIRVHLASEQLPIIGDHLYGFKKNENLPPCERIYLHASLLGFKHPVSDEDIEFNADLPSDFQLFLDGLGRG